MLARSLVVALALFGWAESTFAANWYCAYRGYPSANQVPGNRCTSQNLNNSGGPVEWFSSSGAAIGRALDRYDNARTGDGIGMCIVPQAEWAAPRTSPGISTWSCSPFTSCEWESGNFPSSPTCTHQFGSFITHVGCRNDDPGCTAPPPGGSPPDPRNNGGCGGAGGGPGGGGGGGSDPRNNGSNPINAATGNKYQHEVDYAGAGPNPLRFERHYNSFADFSGTIGERWRHNYAMYLESVDANTIIAHRADGREFEFRFANGSWTPDPDLALTLIEDGLDWLLVDESDVSERYDASGKLVSLQALGGLTTTLTYDGAGRLTSANDGYGRELAFTYDAIGRIQTLTDPAGGAYTFAYSANGNILEVEYPGGAIRTYGYAASGHPHALTSVTDESGTTAGRWEYDSQGRATAYELTGGARRIEFVYNADGTTTTTDAAGGSRVYAFEELHGEFRTKAITGDPCITCGVQAQQYEFDATGFVIASVDRNGVETRYTRDGRGLELSRTEAFGTPQERTVTTEWHATLHLPVKVTRDSLETTYAYDAAGRVLTETAKDLATAETRTTTYTYHPEGQVATVTDPRGNTTSYPYDTAGNLASVTNALGHVTQYGDHDGHGNARLITDANGVQTVLAYDARQRLTSRTIAGRVTQMTYDLAGRLQRVTLPTGSFVEYGYDVAGRLTSLEDAAGNRIEYMLDLMGNRTEERVFGAAGGAAVREHFQAFDTLNRLVESHGGAGNTVGYGYDPVGNRTSVTDALDNSTHSLYDALNRVFKQIDALDGETMFGYDALDRLTQVIDPRGVTTGYTYNAFGDVLTVASPDAGTTTYEYDAAGNRTRQVDARSVVTEYDYDALNRLTAIRYPAHPDSDIAYTWDTAPFGIGRLARIDDDTGSTVFEYDAHGDSIARVSMIRGTTLPLLQAFDGAGNVSSIIHADGREVVYTRDAADRVTAVTLELPGGQSIPIATNVLWEPFGGVQSLTFGNGLQHSRTYDLSGRVTGIATTGVHGLTYQWDATDNITAIGDSVNPFGGQTYGYDALYRLTSASGGYGTLGYQYDAVGNRTQLDDNGTPKAYGYASGSNRLTSAGLQVVSYDAAGNTVDDGERQYVYDARNRMIEADGYEYGYNAFGQRAFKPRFAPEAIEPDDPDDCNPKIETCDDPLPPPDPPPPDAPASGEGEFTQIGWLLFQYDDAGRLIGEYDELGNPVRLYIWLDDIPLAMVNADGVYYLHADHLNTPQRVSDATGAIVWQANLKPFGERFFAGYGELEMPLRFPGQYYDRETGLHQNWHREYAPGIGRYTQKDPIGLDGGINLYSYVQSRPVVQSDSRGLEPLSRGVTRANRIPRFPYQRGPFGDICGPEGLNLATWIPDLYADACEAHDQCYAGCLRSKEECDLEFLLNTPDGPLGRLYGYAATSTRRSQEQFDKARENCSCQ